MQSLVAWSTSRKTSTTHPLDLGYCPTNLSWWNTAFFSFVAGPSPSIPYHQWLDPTDLSSHA